MPVPATFPEFLAQMPGVADYARRMYEQIDLQACLLASAYEAQGRTAESLADLAAQQMAQAAARVGDWDNAYRDAKRNEWRAEQCARDPRLILRPELTAWVQSNDIERNWVNWYFDLLELYVTKREAAEPAVTLSPLADNDNRFDFGALHERTIAAVKAAVKAAVSVEG